MRPKLLVARLCGRFSLMTTYDRAQARMILDLPMDPHNNDAGASSVRDYLARLAAQVWKVGEGFSGKRPFGNSDWRGELEQVLAHAKLVDARWEPGSGYYEVYDERLAASLIANAAAELGLSPEAEKPAKIMAYLVVCPDSTVAGFADEDLAVALASRCGGLLVEYPAEVV